MATGVPFFIASVTQKSSKEEHMASPKVAPARKPPYAPPPVDGDFYRIANVLNDEERSLIKRVREFTEGVVTPVISIQTFA